MSPCHFSLVNVLHFLIALKTPTLCHFSFFFLSFFPSFYKRNLGKLDTRGAMRLKSRRNRSLSYCGVSKPHTSRYD